MSQHLIVGAHFRPPAKHILSCLPTRCPLLIEHEPSNPYDENALKVSVKSSDIPESQHETLAELVEGSGFDLADILAQEEWQLGYIPAVDAKELTPKFNAASTYDANIGFNPAGKPLVILHLSEESYPND